MHIASYCSDVNWLQFRGVSALHAHSAEPLDAESMAWIKPDDLGFEDYTINTLHSRSVELLLLFVKTLTEEIKRYKEEEHTEHTHRH